MNLTPCDGADDDPGREPGDGGTRARPECSASHACRYTPGASLDRSVEGDARGVRHHPTPFCKGSWLQLHVGLKETSKAIVQLVSGRGTVLFTKRIKQRIRSVLPPQR